MDEKFIGKIQEMLHGMDKKQRELYKEIWGDFEGIYNLGIIPAYTRWRESDSKNSLSLSKDGTFVPNNKKLELLMDVFHILEKDRKHFMYQFEIAIGGRGQEIDKITTMHSSSLCAFLFFYNITEDNKLVLPLKTNRGMRMVDFSESVFEFKSPVINPEHPSNMDVVLIGKDRDTKEDILLFLESKFSEYYLYALSSSNRISCEYEEDTYGKVFYGKEGREFLENMSLKKKIPAAEEAEHANKTFVLQTMKEGERWYIGGIKQMISHYIGMRNLLDIAEGKNVLQKKLPKDWHLENEIFEKYIKKGSILLLGEILFDAGLRNLKDGNKRGLSRKECREIYAKKYTELVKKFTQETKNIKNVEFLENELGYSMFFDSKHPASKHGIEPEIREFYFGNQK